MEWVSSEGVEFYDWQNNLGETIRNREFFGGSRERGARPADVPLRVEDRPQAFLTQRPPLNVIQPHFHEMPQYQVVFEGGGRIGKHPVGPISVHYTDAYTPYGPIVAGEEGLGFYTLRGKVTNGGAHYMPQSRARLVRKAGRTLMAEAEVGDLSGLASGQLRIDELVSPTADGVAASLWSLGPHVSAQLEAPPTTGGRFLLVVAGDLLRDGQPYGRGACVHLRPEDPLPELCAGGDGAQLLALQFAPYD